MARLRTWQEQGVVPLPENASQVPGPELSSPANPPILAILATTVPDMLVLACLFFERVGTCH